MCQVGSSHAPGLVYCLLTSRKRHIIQMCQAFKPWQISLHNLATPHSSICSVACSICGDSDYRFLESIFSQYTGNMCMMMLNTNFLLDVHVKSIFCCQVFGIEIICNHFRMDVEKALEMLNSFTKRCERLQILQVTYVVADKGLPPLAQAKRV